MNPFSIVHYQETTSTNDVAARMAEHGAVEGTVVTADAQSAGRGRLGRTWVSPPGAGIYASIVLRPPVVVAPLLTLAVGVALVEGILAATGLSPALKWPNDLYVGPRKLGGILAEGAAGAGAIQHVIVGFGINVLPAAFPAEVAARATSLEGELGRAIDRDAVLSSCLARVAARYDDLREGRAPMVLAQWRTHAATMFGRPVEWESGGTVCRGTTEDIDDGGALLVRTGTGVTRVVAGEMKWL